MTTTSNRFQFYRMRAVTPVFLFLFPLHYQVVSVNAFAIRREPGIDTDRVLCNDQQLSGQVVGEKYLLCDQPEDSTSGKSTICEAYRKCEEGSPTGEPVVVKMSSNTRALQREAENYDLLSSASGTTQETNPSSQEDIGNLFVQVYDHYEPQSQDQSVLVMEKGAQELKIFLRENGPLSGGTLKHVARVVALCIQAMHDRGMVWTEVKTENFVITMGDSPDAMPIVKAIDLESAVPHGSKPLDFTPKTSPPEFATAFLCGRELYLEMDYSHDIWSLGVVLYELAMAKSYFGEGRPPIPVSQDVRNCKGLCVDEIVDPSLRDLILTCANINPEQRPSIGEVLQHPFFQES